MPYPFRFPITVPTYDCDALLNLRASAALRYMQQAATQHLEVLDLPYERLLQEHILFVMAAVAVKFYRAPAPEEKIWVATCPVATKGAQMLRETVLLSEQGALLVEGQSSWAMINPVTKRLLRPSAFQHTLPTLTQWTPFSDPSQLRLSASGAARGTRVVTFSDLDRNMHMNNTIYADVVTDPFGAELLQSGGLDTLFIRYRTQAQMGSTLSLQGEHRAGFFSLSGLLEDGTSCFDGAFTLKPSVM